MRGPAPTPHHRRRYNVQLQSLLLLCNCKLNCNCKLRLIWESLLRAVRVLRVGVFSGLWVLSSKLDLQARALPA